MVEAPFGEAISRDEAIIFSGRTAFGQASKTIFDLRLTAL